MMKVSRLFLYCLFSLVAGLGAISVGRSDEGMWLLNDPPHALLKERHQFDLTQPWLDRAQASSVRFNSGGSGAFVSGRGLVITNHHVGADALAKLSTPSRDLLKDGFLAQRAEDELPCPDLELNVLVSIEDVTARIEEAVKAKTDAAGQNAARRSVMALIEKESLEKTGLRSDVVTLYHGGMYHLYRYRRYTEVKLAFAPESSVAGFGGDVDNFEYPRHGLDFCLFRVYDKGVPVVPGAFLRLHPPGPAEGDLVFVTGHPGSTQRLETVAKLEHRRDHLHPFTLSYLRMLEAALGQYAATSPDAARQASRELHSVANSRKALSGQYQGLLDSKLMSGKMEEEKRLQEAVTDATPWARLAAACQAHAQFQRDHALLERGFGFDSDLFGIARTIVRLSEESDKPDGDRLREYRDSNRKSLELSLYSPAPIHVPLEKVRLTATLTFLAEALGVKHPEVARLLAGRQPNRVASEVVDGSRLADVQERRRLVAGGRAAVASSTDSMIRLALLVDPAARAVRKKAEEEVEEPERQAMARVAQARFQLYGRSMAPEATFTLRLAFGVVKPYAENGQMVPVRTTVAGLFARHDLMGGSEPFHLPASWLKARDRISGDTPLNFISTADTIGGNSGSPVIDRQGRLIGVNFDRNRPGLVRNFVYTDVGARHVAVHAGAIALALRDIYGAKALLAEMLD